MEDKNQTLINKIKCIKRLSPINKEQYLKKIESDEMKEKNNYNNYDNNNKKSSYNYIQKPNSKEKDLFKDKIGKKEKEKSSSLNNSVNKSKNLTPLIHKHRKKQLNHYENNIGLIDNQKNIDDSIDKRQNIYENQRKPSFFKQYIAKMRESEDEEEKNFTKRTKNKSGAGNYSHRDNSRTRENLRNLIENIKRKKAGEKNDDYYLYNHYNKLQKDKKKKEKKENNIQ